MTFSRCMFAFALSLSIAGHTVAQGTRAQPGQFDFYLLNLSWAPEFCQSPAGQHADHDTSLECATPHGFILHGLWPTDFDGSYPASCSNAPGPQNPSQYLDITPDLSLIAHEWQKHGTCSGLAAGTYFSTAREAYTSVTIPDTLKNLAHPLMLTPDALLSTFYQSNPAFPPGSFALSCGNNRLTAIEACFSKDTLHPIPCQNVATCKANNVKITPEITDSIVQ